MPLRQAVRPYVHTPIESSFEGHFQGFLKVLGEEELRTHQIKSVFQHQPTLSLLQIFQTPVKPILAMQSFGHMTQNARYSEYVLAGTTTACYW